jgi:hypothetical protein
MSGSKETSVNHTLYVPVRMSAAGVLALRTGRLQSGERTGLAFTSLDTLAWTLGPAQQWVSLGEEPLRDMLAPLGIRLLRVDPLPFCAPGPPDKSAHGGLLRRQRQWNGREEAEVVRDHLVDQAYVAERLREVAS